MGQHALLSASASKRWMNCTPSARLEEKFPEEESTFAAEGSAAHALAEHKLRKYMKLRSRKPRSEYDSDELDEYTDQYVNYAIERIEEGRKNCMDTVVLIEQRLDYSTYVEGGFGTGDLIIVRDNTLEIIDLKYGRGVSVEAERNPQMMLYALGALELFDTLYDIETVRMTIHQPRLESISSWEISVDDLKVWAEEDLRPKAELAIKGDGDFSPGPWCQFCRARKVCRARAEEFLKHAQLEFKRPALLSDVELEEILTIADELKKWVEDIYTYASDEAISKGKTWTGFKVVEGRSNRKYLDEEQVVEAANSAGYTDIYKKSLIGISEMEKLMGKKNFNEVLGDLVYKPSGKLTLVPKIDKRKPIFILPATAEFKEEI